jgi:Zn-dependent peptidase ImmA (M78 family)
MLRVIETDAERTFEASFYDPDTETIWITGGLDEQERTISLLHEIAHYLLGHDCNVDDATHEAVERFARDAAGKLNDLRVPAP